LKASAKRAESDREELEMRVYELHAIKYADLNGRKRSDLFVGGDPHDGRIDMDYFVWVAVSAGRAYVVDTGFGPEVAARRGRHYIQSPAESLSILGIDARQVEDVVITHMHFDHAGNFELFPNARFHIQDREMAFVTGRQMTHPFMRNTYEVDDVVGMVRAIYNDRVVFHDGDSVIAPGIEAFLVGGHTRGLQAVRIATQRGAVVLASDASHYYENFEQGRVFSILDSAADVLEGYRRLKELAARPELIVPGHDPLVMRRYPRSDIRLGRLAVRLDVDPDGDVLPQGKGADREH
jgi:glyoxylase-like metal-dependent hydrolase (beta-lactamase superfamily II)